MIHKNYHLHTILDENHLTFLAADYSSFKYGSKSVARKFGKQMGKELADLLPIDKQFVIIPAPYNYIPTATFALKDYLLAELNKRMTDRGMENPIQESKVFRPPVSYSEDYGNMCAEKRKQAIGGELFHVDVKFLEGKVALLVDDIRVTGAHEERMHNMIERLQPSCECIFIYFARVEGVVDPTIEGRLNRYAMRNLLDLDRIIKNDEFIFNTRNVKFMLSSDYHDFKEFIAYQKKKFRETLYSLTIGNSYHKNEGYKQNIQYLKSLL